MSLLPGYRVLDTVHQSESSIVYLAVRESDNHPFVLKLLNKSYPTPAQIRQFQHEFRVSQLLEESNTTNPPTRPSAGARAAAATEWSDSPADKPVSGRAARSLELVEHQRRHFIVMEHCAGQPLNMLLKEGPLPIGEALAIGMELVGLLGRIHEAGIVHKDINPSNLIYDRASGQLRLIDFGIASLMTREATAFYGSSSLLGTPAYLSPEQTGRMNRSVDYRSDFYSFGVTLYELLTGVRPFASNDLMALVHCHIAKAAEPPDQVLSSISAPLSRIVMKLLAKNAEDRYQSALLLRVELKRCLDTTRGVAFAVNSTNPPDVSRYLNIPEKLLGRERELACLQAAFAEVQAGATRMVLISGSTGVGKTRLVKELHQPITAQRGNFAEGKFELLKRDVPYAAFIQVFRQLLSYLSMQTESSLSIWRRRILAAIEPNAGMIIDLIPEFVTVLGPQPLVPGLSPTETRNRFKVVIQSLIRAFTVSEHPLVIFLDDLQWADAASFDLLESLVGASASGHLLLVGAYRDNEMEQNHRLNSMVGAHSTSPLTLAQNIELKPLTAPDLTRLVGNTLGFSNEQAAPLAQLLHRRTGGNPLFVGQYLQLLDNEGVLAYDEHSGWNWDPVEAERKPPTASIAELIRTRLVRLSPAAQTLLNLAACVGDRFSLQFLAEIEAKSPEQLSEHLNEAIRQELVQNVAPVVKPISETSSPDNEQYRFLHDQIHAAAYHLEPAETRLARHRQVGEALLRAGGMQIGGNAMFDVLYHLNQIDPGLLTVPERDRIAGLNLQAAREAQLTAAFEHCLSHARSGLSFLHGPQTIDRREPCPPPEITPASTTPSPWSRQYPLTYDLCLLGAQAAYWNLAFDLMDELLAEILKNAKSLLERVRAHEVHTMAHISRGQLSEGIQTGLMALSLLGVTFPPKPRQRHIALGYLKTRLALLGRTPEGLRAMAPIHSEHLLAVFRILKEIDAAVFLSRPDLFPLTVFKQIQLSVKHGNAAESAAAYCTFGLVLGGIMGNFELGTRFGRLALGVLEDFDSRELYPRVHFLNNYFIRPWKEPFADVLDSMLETQRVAVRVGDFEYAAYLLDLHLACSYHSGVPLARLDELAGQYVQRITELGQKRTLRTVQIRWQTIRSMMEPAAEPWRMTGSICNAEALRATMVAAGDTHGQCDLLVNRLILCYHYYQYDEALLCLEGIEDRFGSLAGEILMPLYYFYCPLVHIARFARLSAAQQRLSRTRIRHCRKQLGKWATSSPANYAHKRLLVEAAWAELKQRNDAAREFYDAAITIAETNGYGHELGLINELAGNFYLRLGRESLATHYLNDARYAYELWGAARRTNALIARFPQLAIEQTRLNGSVQHIPNTNQANIDLDSISVIKSSQAISGEIRIERLLSEIMRIALENAGAQRSTLLLEQNGNWFIEAVGPSDQSDIEVEQHIPLDQEGGSANLPISLVRYVIRTKTVVVVDSLLKDRRFDADPYLSQHKPESILCMPFLRHGKLAGILYLENRTTSHAFTKERLDVLKVLCAQAAISIENARLFADMSALTASQKRFVPAQFLQIMNRMDIRDVKVGDYVDRDMSVLFCDLRHFTALAESLPPDQTIELLNLYFGAMELPIQEHGGFIDAFTGDEIMVLFDGPADDALDAAVAMFEALNTLNLQLAQSHGIELAMGVGINTGRLLLGTVGGRERIKCGVVGDTVNLASRIESLTKDYDAKILISETTHESLQRPERFRIQRLEKVRARGKSNAVMIFEVLVA